MTAFERAMAGLVPPEAPLPMLTQSLSEWHDFEDRPSLSPRLATALARWFVFGMAIVISAYATWEMLHVVGQERATWLQIVLVFLFALTFFWIALAAATAMLGLAALSLYGRPPGAQLKSGDGAPRTAIVMPIYNEEAGPVFTNLRRMAEELIAAGEAAHFDIFVLSDSTDARAAPLEEQLAKELRHRLVGSIEIYYRRRGQNEGRKAGNIAEFVRRWGARYDFMIVLDADSYMTAQAIVTLAEAIAADPRAGLIQSAPRLIGGTTLFARLQQFATATYGPLLSTGLALWHGMEGNYWGHNAIIRMGAFAGACGLPELEGRGPFGGHILSHDFVEAALLRRAAFAVYMQPDIGGSYEGTPPTLSEHAVRDRRWAQGNLQHGKVVSAAGLHWISRYHLINGIMSYVASPLWLLFLATGIILSVEASLFPPDYFPSDFALFPSWPRFDAQRALGLLAFTLLVLLTPKLLSLLTVLSNPVRRRERGGAAAITFSVVLETILSALLAPVLMLMQSQYVLEILIGRDSGWSSQHRRQQDLSMRDLLRRHGGHMAIGVLLCLIGFSLSFEIWLWLLPIWFGLLLTIPLVLLTSSRSVGESSRRMKLFLTPEE